MRDLRVAFCAAGLLVLTLLPAQGATVSKTYNYFSIGGSTLEEIENELTLRGPQVKSTGKRHPGATQMEFTSRLTYAEKNGRCWIADAKVNMRAKVTLPRWKPRAKTDGDVRLIWETLASDIKRHEESHIVIARNYARELEQSLKAIRRQKTCAAVAAKAQAVQTSVLARHDAAQDRFDKIEGMNFEKRILGLLQYRLQRMRASAKAQ
jgi:predicted secreted Zn-dependent protease